MNMLRTHYLLVLLIVSGACCPGSALGDAAGAVGQSKWLGTNLSANDPWSTAAPWCDVAHQMTGWYKARKDQPPLQYDDNGYPQGPAMCHLWLYAYPTGTYHLHYRAARNFWVSGKRVRNLHTTADGAREADVDFKTDEFIRFEVDGPVSDVHLYAPDAKPGQMFRDAFLNYLRPYAVVRLMTWCKINNGGDGSGPPPIHLSNRVKATDWDQTTRGVAYEFQAELCREAGVQPWANVPYGADDEYIAAEATCFAPRAGSQDQPFQTVRWEYGNELWNTTLGPQGMQIRKDADPNVYGPGDPNQRGARRAAALTAHAGAIARRVLGKDHALVVFGAQAAWNAWASDGLAFAKPGDIDVLAVAPYFQPTWKTPIKNVSDMLASCDQWITTVIEPGLTQNKAAADKYGCAFEAYEGGQHLMPANRHGNPEGNPQQRQEFANDLSTLAQNDPQMGALYDRLFAVSRQHGIRLFCHFLVIGPWNRWGYWGLYPRTGDPDGVKAAAVKRAMAAR
ncbi:MAG TPA: hypothetical protein VN541_22490 [Tepidisphaeraceae bacterium]|nr:hypothetical protein [Tepidisphaeraceae bacterium]